MDANKKEPISQLEIADYAKTWNPNNPYLLWGAGLEGSRAIQLLCEHITIRGVIDTDIQKHGQLLLGYIIYPYKKAKVFGCKIIITMSAYLEVRERLIMQGFVEDVDFTYWKKFAGIYFWYYKNRLYSYQIDISITQRCSLNCRHCNMWMPLFTNPVDRDINRIFDDIDRYFSCIDYVSVINLLGGEPFLHKHLPDIIDYIWNNWADRIGEMQIYTNGTIIPDETTIDICLKHNVIMNISDYSNTIFKIKPFIENFILLLNKNRFNYRIKSYDKWLDFGFPYAKKTSYQEAIKMFISCRAPFRGLYDGKIYYCHIQASAEQLGLFEGNDNDWVVLDGLDKNRIKVLRLDLGYLQNGIITFCLRCDGCGKSNKRTIPVAEQMSRKCGGK